MASNSYTLEVIANTAKYQQELARIPGLTEKQAAAAALKMASAQEKAQQKMAADAEKYAKQAAEAQEAAFDEASRAAEHAAERQREAADKAADGFGKIGESAGKLGGVLEMLGVEGASTIADLADAGEVAAEAFGGLSGSLGIIGNLLGPLAITVGLVGGAFWVLQDAASQSNAAMEESAKQADILAKALDGVREAQKGTSDALKSAANDLAVSTGGLEDYELAASNAANAVRDGAAAEMGQRTAALALAEAQLATARAYATAGDALSGTMAQGIKDSNRLEESVKQQRRELDNLIERTDAAAQVAAQQIIKDGEAAKTKDKATESTKAHASAVKEDAAALAAQAAAVLLAA